MPDIAIGDINHDAPVSVFEQCNGGATRSLSISNIPLSRALLIIGQWPSERREQAVIALSNRLFVGEEIEGLNARLSRRDVPAR